MQPNIPLGAKHHHIAIRVETNHSRRRPTSWSLSKLPISGLYWKLFARGSTFLLDLPGTTGLIAGKPREKVELLSLRFSPPFSLSLLSSLPTVLFGLKSSSESTFFLSHVNTPLAPWITLITLSIYLGSLSNHVLPHVSYGSHLSSLFDLPCT